MPINSAISVFTNTLFMIIRLLSMFKTSSLLLALLLASAASHAEKLTIGITLQPYFSYVKAVVGDTANVLPLVDEGSVGNGVVNPHTFVGVSTTIQKVYTIANEMAKIDPEHAKQYRKNARAYALKFRKMKHQAMMALNEVNTTEMKVATTHNAYGYILQEFGVDVSAVIEPAHGVEPSASQLQETIEKIKRSGIDVLFYELNMPNRYVDTIEKETGIKLYRFSHMTHGAYQADKVEIEMRSNLKTLVEAMKYTATQREGA